MAMRASEIRGWLEGLEDDPLIAVDEGGLTLVVVGNADDCDVGGEPLPEERMPCPFCGGNGKADGIGDPRGLYGSDNCGACGGSGTLPGGMQTTTEETHG